MVSKPVCLFPSAFCLLPFAFCLSNSTRSTGLQWPDAEADPLPQADVNDLRQRQKVSGAAED
jgi:hypothetical protein